MPELRRSARVSKSAAPVLDVEPPKKRAKKTSTASEPASVPADSNEIQVGDKIPDLTLLDEDENEINLKEAASKTKFLIIFAYPKASTPGCTRQVCGFQKNFEFLQKSDVTVFGLSADQPKSQKNFVTKQHLKYPLLSDPSKKLIGVLGAKKSPLGIKRSHWIFVDGILKVKKIQISPENSFNGAKLDIEQFLSEKEELKEEPEVESKEETKEEVKEEEPKEEPKEEEPKVEEPKVEPTEEKENGNGA